MSWSYDYYADGRVYHAYDQADHTFDRSQEYDHAGRLREAYSGREVSGQPPTSPADNPYRQTYQYDVWDNQIAKTDRFWRSSQSEFWSLLRVLSRTEQIQTPLPTCYTTMIVEVKEILCLHFHGSR